MKKLTQERLKEVLHYNPETGIFTRLVSRGNAIAGALAGSPDKDGYLIINIDKKAYKSHRLAWLYMEGYIPHGIEIDHIDRNPSNNRWENLRLTSHKCNMQNKGNNKNNTSGVTGVSWDKQSNKWRVHIQANLKKKPVGRYIDFHEAVCARLASEQCVAFGGCSAPSPAFCYVRDYINQNIK